MDERRKLALQLAQYLSEDELQRLVKRAEARAKGPTVNWQLEQHTCPRCGHEGPVDPDFGVKLVRGVVRKQSWCVYCRSTVSYHARPRTRGVR